VRVCELECECVYKACSCPVYVLHAWKCVRTIQGHAHAHVERVVVTM